MSSKSKKRKSAASTPTTATVTPCIKSSKRKPTSTTTKVPARGVVPVSNAIDQKSRKCTSETLHVATATSTSPATFASTSAVRVATTSLDVKSSDNNTVSVSLPLITLDATNLSLPTGLEKYTVPKAATLNHKPTGFNSLLDELEGEIVSITDRGVLPTKRVLCYLVIEGGDSKGMECTSAAREVTKRAFRNTRSHPSVVSMWSYDDSNKTDDGQTPVTRGVLFAIGMRSNYCTRIATDGSTVNNDAPPVNLTQFVHAAATTLIPCASTSGSTVSTRPWLVWLVVINAFQHGTARAVATVQEIAQWNFSVDGGAVETRCLICPILLVPSADILPMGLSQLPSAGFFPRILTLPFCVDSTDVSAATAAVSTSGCSMVEPKK